MSRQKSKVVSLLASAGALSELMSGSVAQAHVCLDAPVSRVGDSCDVSADQKDGPCGIVGRTSNVTTFRPGETITVELNETIDHPSHYRIAFNPNGDTFEDPTSKDDKDGKHPYVLLDNITDVSAAKQSVKVTLPNVTCDKCTLQLIQVMYDKGANGFGGSDGSGGKADNDDLYYACADIILKAEPVGGETPTAGDAGSADADAAAPQNPKPSTDAGAGQMSDAGAPKPTSGGDGATTPSARVDAGKTTSTQDAGKRPSAPANDAEDEEEDATAKTSDDGCSLAASPSHSSGAALGWLLSLGMLVTRRQKRLG